MNKQIPVLSIDAKTLYEKLCSVAVGERVTYEQLTQCIGRNVQDKAYGALTTARRMAQRENRIVFGVVRGQGLIRLNDSDIVDAGSNGLAKTRRVVKKHAKILSCVQDFNQLSNEEKLRHNAALSLYGAIAQATKPTTVKQVESAVNASAGALPVGKTLQLFM